MKTRPISFKEKFFVFKKAKGAEQSAGINPAETGNITPDKRSALERITEIAKTDRQALGETIATSLTKLEKAKTAWDTVEAIYGKDVRTKKNNFAKRKEIWAEMQKTEPFKGKAEQNLEIRKYLKAKLREVQDNLATVETTTVPAATPAAKQATEPPAATSTATAAAAPTPALVPEPIPAATVEPEPTEGSGPAPAQTPALAAIAPAPAASATETAEPEPEPEPIPIAESDGTETPAPAPAAVPESAPDQIPAPAPAAESEPPAEELPKQFFANFSAVEKTARTLNPGKYQLAKDTTIYQEGGAIPSQYENGQFQYLEISDPRIYKITKNGESIYVVKVDQFKWTNRHKLGFNLENSPGDRAKNPGFVNIEDIIVGHRDHTPERLIKPTEIESDWTKEPKLKEDETLTKDKIYSLKEGTDLYTTDHRPTKHLRKSLKVKVTDTKIREVEGKEYVAVEIVGLKGWIEKGSLIIPEEDNFFMTPGETSATPITAEERSKLNRLGIYQLKAKTRGSDLLRELFEKFKTDKLEEKLADSGISTKEYLEALHKTRERDTLQIIEPTKTLAKLMGDYEKTAINPKYKEAVAKEKLRIYRERKNYFENDFRLTDKKLLEYINDDEKWNDLWERINEQGDEFIDGIETVIAILGKFGKKDIEIKDDLRELLQEWCNEEVTFEEVFDRYIKGTQYKEGDFDNFKTEFEGLVRKLKPWSGSAGVARLKAVRAYHTALAELNAVKDKVPNWETTPEYANYQKVSEKKLYGQPIKDIVQIYLYNNVQIDLDRLSYLRTNILEPVATLLDTIETLKVKTSAKETFYDKNRRLFENLPAVDEPKIDVWTERGKRPIIPQEYFDLQRLTERKPGELKSLEDAEMQITAITVKQEINDQFDAIAKQFGIKEDSFNYGDQLRIIFELYSLDTLAKEGCLSKIKDKDNKFILSALPASFNAENPKIKELFIKIKTRNDIDSQKQTLEQLRKSLDQNTATLARLNEVFGEDRGMDKSFNWREKLEAWFTGDDTREITLTMSDVGARRVTKPTGDFLRKYMSGNAAISYLLPRITTHEKGVETYSNEALKKELKKRLRIGLDNLFVSDHFQFIREKVLRPFGKIDDPKTLEAAYEAYSKQIDDTNRRIDIHAIQVIRIGEVLLHVFEENKEVEYSASPEIRQIQEALVKAGYSKTDIKKVESILLLGVVVGVNGDIGLGAGVPINLGDGWTLTPAAGVSSAGVGVGAGVSKTVELSKDGRTALTFGVHGGYLAVGGHATLRFPISDTLDGRVSGAAGITAIGFYAGGGIGLRKNTNAQQMKAFAEAQKKKGFTETVELIKKGASPAEIREAMFKIPVYGVKFKELKTKYNLKDEALRELFVTMQDELESKVTGEFGVSATNIDITEGGISAGVINGLPVVIPYIVLKLGEEFVVVRSVLPGYENMQGLSDDRIKQMITEQVGQNITMLHESTGETGHVIFDTVTRGLAIVQSDNTIDLHKFDTFAKTKEELKKIRVDVSKDSDGITLEALTPKAKPGNIKYSIDPTVGYNFTVKNGKLLVAGIDTEGLKNLIITREDFYYPNETPGKSNILSIITIKTNPARTRLQIEQESTHFLYKGADHRLDIHEGIARTGHSNIIEASTYETAPIRTRGIESFDLKHFEEFKKRKKEALHIMSKAEFEQAPRSGIIPEFADKFYEENKLKFRQLTTIGQETFKPRKLIEAIENAAKKTEFKTLNNQELNQVMLYLTTKSFMNAKDKKKVFEKNLKFAEKEVLTPMFEKIGTKLGLANTQEEMATKAKAMAAKVASDLKNTDFTSTNFETFAAGTIFLSTVGTMKISGLRGTPYYSSELDLAGHILNFHNYDPGADGVDGDVGKALLALLSPVDDDPEKFQKFLVSPLALKLAAHDGIYLILEPDDAMKVVECFKNGEVNPANRVAFEKFRQIVLKVRETQNRGGNFINLPNGYRIRFRTEVGMGVYDKCTNPSMAGTEELEIFAPRQGAIVAGTEQFVRLNPKLTKKDIEVLVGVRAVFEDEAAATSAPPKPRAGSGQKTDQESGTRTGGPSDVSRADNNQAAEGFRSNE